MDDQLLFQKEVFSSAGVATTLPEKLGDGCEHVEKEENDIPHVSQA